MKVLINGIELPLTEEILDEARKWTMLELRAATEALQGLFEMNSAPDGLVTREWLNDVALETANVAKFAKNSLELAAIKSEA